MNVVKQILLLILLMLSFSCGNERSNFLGFDTRLKIMNNQSVDYYYCTSFTYPNLELVDNLYSTRYTLPSMSTDIYTHQCCWEELLMECCSGYLILDFFEKEKYERAFINLFKLTVKTVHSKTYYMGVTVTSNWVLIAQELDKSFEIILDDKEDADFWLTKEKKLECTAGWK